MRLALAALALVATLPPAAALDVLPSEMTLGARDARLVLRVGEGMPVRIHAEPAVDVALVPVGAAPELYETTPTTLAAPAGEWHGLTGVVELVLRRDSARRDIAVEIDDGGDAGYLVDWPASLRGVPAGGAALLAGALALGALAGRKGQG